MTQVRDWSGRVQCSSITYKPPNSHGSTASPTSWCASLDRLSLTTVTPVYDLKEDRRFVVVVKSFDESPNWKHLQLGFELYWTQKFTQESTFSILTTCHYRGNTNSCLCECQLTSKACCGRLSSFTISCNTNFQNSPTFSYHVTIIGDMIGQYNFPFIGYHKQFGIFWLITITLLVTWHKKFSSLAAHKQSGIVQPITLNKNNNKTTIWNDSQSHGR